MKIVPGDLLLKHDAYVDVYNVGLRFIVSIEEWIEPGPWRMIRLNMLADDRLVTWVGSKEYVNSSFTVVRHVTT